MSRKNVTVNVCRFPGRVKPLLARAARAVFRAEKKDLPGEVTLVMVSDAEIRKLNRRYRKVNRITDVISFRFSASPALTGDIYIAEGRSKKQAGVQKHSWEKELTYLTVHGVLHLFGYADYAPAERKAMFSRQDAIWEDLF